MISLRMDNSVEDDEADFKRTEHVRMFAPGDPDYDRVYSLRSDIEANNRQLEDTLWLGRAHSAGAAAQLLDLLGYAVVYNSVALMLCRERAGTSLAA